MLQGRQRGNTACSRGGEPAEDLQWIEAGTRPSGQPPDRQLVGRIGEEAEVGDHVEHLGPPIEAARTPELVRDSGGAKCENDGTGEGVGPDQERGPAQWHALPSQRRDPTRDLERFVEARRGVGDLDPGTGSAEGAERLRHPVRVVGDQRGRGGDHVGAAPAVASQ